MEKQANNLSARSFFSNTIVYPIFILFFFCSLIAKAQSTKFISGKEYVIDSIQVVGLKSFNKKTVISYSGLRKGQKVRLPGDQISSVINKLWNLDLFSDINFYATNVKDNSLTLQIEIEELPTLNEVKIYGLKKGKIQGIINDTELEKEKNSLKVF